MLLGVEAILAFCVVYCDKSLINWLELNNSSMKWMKTFGVNQNCMAMTVQILFVIFSENLVSDALDI